MSAKEDLERLFEEFRTGDLSDELISQGFMHKKAAAPGGAMRLKINTNTEYYSLEVWGNDPPKEVGMMLALLVLSASGKDPEKIRISAPGRLDPADPAAPLVGQIIQRASELRGLNPFQTIRAEENFRA